jgi:hypothetical protein
MPRRPPRQEWEPPAPVSVDRNGVIHNGHYELESGRGENRMIRVTCDRGPTLPPTRLGAMDPESLARGLLLEIVVKQTKA